MRRAFRAGLRSIRRTPVEQTVAMGTIAVSLLLVLIVRMTALNVGRVAAEWGRGVQMTVYLDDTATPAHARVIAETLAKLPGVERVRTVEPREAWERLKKSLGERADLLDGVEDTMLPTSIEVSLKEGASDLVRMHPAFDKLRHTPGVEDVELMGDWVDRIAALERVIRAVGMLLAALVGAGCVYIVASTIRLGVFARRDEIEILKLVGATDGFVKSPFLVEGTLQGAAGAAFALATAYAIYRVTAPWIERTLGAAVCAAPVAFLPPLEVLAALLGGAALGLFGSFLAVARHVRE